MKGWKEKHWMTSCNKRWKFCCWWNSKLFWLTEKKRVTTHAWLYLWLIVNYYAYRGIQLPNPVWCMLVGNTDFCHHYSEDYHHICNRLLHLHSLKKDNLNINNNKLNIKKTEVCYILRTVVIQLLLSGNCRRVFQAAEWTRIFIIFL